MNSYFCQNMDCEKSAMKYADVFTNPKQSQHGSSADDAVLKFDLPRGCIHQSNSSNKLSQELCSESDHPCHTCHSIKSDFSHEHGQHIDNSFILLHKISLLYQNHDLSDIRIGVGHKVFHAHKLILSSSSDVFGVMLMNQTWPESRTNHVLLKEEPECEEVFEDFLKYMYLGSIHLTHYSVLPVLMLADKYNVCDLREICLQYMCEHLVSTTTHNQVVSWLQYAQTCAHQHMASQCHHFILANFHKIINCKDFMLMSQSLLQSYLSCSELVIPDEFTLFKGLSSWLQHQKATVFSSKEDYSDFYYMALDLLSDIRFPMIGPVHLSQLEQDPLREYFTDFFVEKMLTALDYHFGNNIDLASSTAPAKHWQLRNYTNDVWSTSLSIDNFLSLPQHDAHLMFFSTPVSASQADENRCWEWSLDLFPKGVTFGRCIMIGLWRNLELCGMVYNNIRLVLSTKQPDVRKVHVAILVKGVQDNVEYVKHVVQQHCIFDKDKQIFHFNDIVPFDELNCTDSKYLSGPDNDVFKVVIIIKPV